MYRFPKPSPDANERSLSSHKKSKGASKQQCIILASLIIVSCILGIIFTISFGAKEIHNTNEISRDLNRWIIEQDGGKIFQEIAQDLANRNASSKGRSVYFYGNYYKTVREFCRLDRNDDNDDDTSASNSEFENVHCFVPLKDDLLFEDEGSPQNPIVSLEERFLKFLAPGYYQIVLSAKTLFTRDSCPWKKIKLSLWDVTDGVSLGNIWINAISPQQLNISVLLHANTQIGVRIHSYWERGVRPIRIELAGSIKHLVDFSYWQSVITYDITQKVMWVPQRPPSLPEVPVAYPPQYPTDNSTYFSLAPVIPHKPQQLSPNQTTHFKKFDSVPRGVMYCLGINPDEISPEDPRLSVFLTNYEERGPDNYRKKVYMSALHSIVVTKYSEKMDAFINKVYADAVTYGKPVIGTFREALIRFFLNVHVGEDDYPEVVIKYFSQFEDNIAHADILSREGASGFIYDHLHVEEVKTYFQKRNVVVQSNRDKTCLLYHWNEAGLDPEALVMEAVHNIQAFAQFSNVLYLLVTDSLSGTTFHTEPPVTIQYDFFHLYDAATTDEARLNVVREAFRLLVPNAVSFSKAFSDPSTIPEGTNVRSNHVHQMLMMQASAAANGGNAAAYFNYDPSLYSAFQTDFSQTDSSWHVPDTHSSYHPEDFFINSPIDGETILDKSNPKLISVFNTPLYAPFGLGYRRCPGEIFSYLFVMKMMDRFKDVTFEFRPITPNTGTVSIAPFTVIPDNIYCTHGI